MSNLLPNAIQDIKPPDASHDVKSPHASHDVNILNTPNRQTAALFRSSHYPRSSIHEREEQSNDKHPAHKRGPFSNSFRSSLLPSLLVSSHLISPFFSPAGTAARRARVHKVRSRLPLFRALIMIIGRPLLRLVEGIATRVAKGVSAAFYFTQSKVEVGSWDIRCDDD